MKTTKYDELVDLVWNRIMFFSIQKIQFEKYNSHFQKINDDLAYNSIKKIIELFADDKSNSVIVAIISNLFLQIGIKADENLLNEIVEDVEINNQDEIMAFQIFTEMLENNESIENIFAAIEIILSEENE
jgi:hypothetical protein